MTKLLSFPGVIAVHPVTKRLSEDVVETAWDTEILKRIGEYERGEAVLWPAADVFAEARRLTQ